MALSKILENSITDGVVSAAKLKDFAAAVDLNGVELILDADQDTSITADTDDRIDFKIAGVEHISISNSSGDTIIKPMVDAKDIVFQQYDGNKIFEINDANFVAVSGAAAGPGEIRIYEDTDNGTHYTGFKAGNNTASVAYVLPTADGTSGHQLTTDGSGTLSWSSAGTTLANDANNRVVTGTGSGLNGEANLTFDGSTLAVTGAATVSGNLTGSGTVQGTTITATTAFVPDASDGAALGTTALEFSDLFLADASTIQFGADQDVILTHVADTGLLLSGTNVIQFNDASQNIGAPSNAILDINATDEIELNATLVDVNANLDVSGTITSGGIITGTAFTAGSAVLAEAELELLDGLTAGTAIASKVVTTDANIDSTGMRNLTISGELDAATLDISGNADIDGTLETDALSIASTAVTATAAELNILDGVTATAAEINLIDGDTSRGTTAIADGDGVLINDAGTMRMTTVQTLSAYLDDEITAMPNLITIGAAATATTLAGIPFYRNDTSYYTHDVSGTDNAAEYNSAFGFTALDAITTGDKNVAIGYQALTAAQTTQDSVVIGVQAGAALTGGSTNIIIGVNALDTATTCDENIAIGAHSLGGSLDDATRNVCMGRYTGESITTGDNNTFIGHDAGSDQTTAGGNTFIGYKCGHGPTTGGSNNAVGSDSLAALTSGYYNNAIGSGSLYSVTEGHNNIAIGHDSGSTVTTGDHNTYIGYKTKASGTNVDNEIIIGHGVHTTNFTAGGTGTIKMGMHNNNINNTFTSNANWSHSSDERWKKNIADNPIGLDFINDLRTVTYNWRAFSEIDPSLSEYNAEDTKYPHPGIQHGMIAQEVRTAMDKHGIEEFGGWYEDKLHEDKQQGISESMYVIPLIKAVQELSAKVKDLELKLEDK